jgi:hypothetical protein
MSRSRSQAGRLARRKGHQHERDVAEAFRPFFPTAHRTVDQVRTARVAGPDVEGTPWWIECEHAARTDVAAKLAQAERDSDGRPALVVAKRNRCAPVLYCRLAVLTREPSHRMPVTVSLDHFLATLTPAALEPQP